MSHIQQAFTARRLLSVRRIQMLRNWPKRLTFLMTVVTVVTAHVQADDFEEVLKPLLAQTCVKCHGDSDANAEVNFQRIVTAEQLLDQPQLIQRMLEAIDTRAMPPDGEPALDENVRSSALAVLKPLLREASGRMRPARAQLRRLNRFQYNNTVRDLFRLNRDVFALSEKLMTRHDDYLQRPPDHPQHRQMPDVVHVASHSLAPESGLQDVTPFPKDLRAEHGFDNQANQLTLSPILLDAFLRLSVSIVESPDFNEQSVGIWNEFFREPEDVVDEQAEVRVRMARFLRIAFRGPVDDDTLNRYTNYAVAKMGQGLSFSDGMKKAASAVLSSPLFLYRSPAVNAQDRQLALASRLSYFLWGSCPDEELLTLTERGQLSDPATLDRTVTRMLRDPRIERFLDSFPSQWMQLENLLAATPDPQINRYFSLDPRTPASLQMVLEPLLLFDAVFLENRPIVELIAPPFSYHSDFLQTWYTSDLQPPPVDTQQMIADNRRRDEQRTMLQTLITAHKAELNELIEPVRKRLLDAERDQHPEQELLDLRPFAAWEFDGDLQDSIRELDLTAHGDVSFHDGMVVLDKTYLLSRPLPVDLRAKTLEVRCLLQNPDQPGGGLMGIQGPGDFFDTIVIGERKKRHWISGSNGFRRTEDFPDSTEETGGGEMLHLMIVYAEDGTTTLYRNGHPYGHPFRKAAATFPRDRSSVIFGLRHLPPGGNKFLSVSIDQARLYNRELTPDEVAAAAGGYSSVVSDADLTAALTPQQRRQKSQLTAAIAEAQTAWQQIPANVDLKKVQQEVQREFENDLREKLRSRVFRRVKTEDPRYGGIITNAAMLTMTSGPTRTHPVARGVWIIEAIFNDPPPPPPNDVPPLDEDSGAKDLTIREQFAVHRANPSCAGCHAKLDPLGFAMENFDITGRWRDRYSNGRVVDPAGTLLRKHEFDGVVRFKESLVQEQRRFGRAFTEHLLRFALARELGPQDVLTVDSILKNSEDDGFPIRSLIREVVLSEPFVRRSP